MQPDAAAGPDGAIANACGLPASMQDLGDLTALKAQRCNVNGSMGTQKWYRLSATLAETGDIVQLELWPGTGAFSGGAVRTGTFPVDTDYATCGVCVRAVGDKGTATAHEYLATAGSVTITAIGANGAPIAATITSATLGEIDPVSHLPVAMGCSVSLARVQVSGTVMDVGGTGTGGGGGGGGGGGTGSCPAGIGD